MKDKAFHEWGKTKEKGILRFTLKIGLLAWGLPMFIIMAFINKPFAKGFTSSAAIIHYIVWPIAGIIFGLVVWYIIESNYKKEIKKRENT